MIHRANILRTNTRRTAVTRRIKEDHRSGYCGGGDDGPPETLAPHTPLLQTSPAHGVKVIGLTPGTAVAQRSLYGCVVSTVHGCSSAI